MRILIRLHLMTSILVAQAARWQLAGSLQKLLAFSVLSKSTFAKG